MDPSDIGYLSMIIESYDGMAVVRTIDPKAAVIEILMSPGCEDLMSKLLNSLIKDEGLILGRIE